MSDILVDAHEIHRSREFFMSEQAYRPLELNSEFQRMVSCIDPRDEDREQLKVIIQTAGGAAGKGLDSAKALTAFNPNDDNRVFSVEEGAQYDSELQRLTVIGAHPACKFILGISAVSSEMTNPSDLTGDVIRSLKYRYELADVVGFDAAQQGIADAGKRMQDQLDAVEHDSLLDTISALYPDRPNVAAMKGENRAAFYIMNHHPHVGLDRQAVHREKKLVAQAYHDSLGATIQNLSDVRRMPRDLKLFRLAALVMRSAATRTVLCGNDPNITFLDVVPKSGGGLQVQEDFTRTS